MYNFLTGPALWIAFATFGGGLIIRIGYLFVLSKKKDRVFYNHASFKWGFKSIVHWIIPWYSASMRQQPLFTFMFFVFHVCLIAIPLFFQAHNVLWEEAFGCSLWSMPDGVADVLTVVLIAAGIFLCVRRVARPEVRILTSPWDYCLLVLTLLPFLSGFLAYHQWGRYETLLIGHILASEILLVLIPFTKLGHMILFFFTRAFIGFEMGSRRGARSW
ncbi:MAG: nitrate reductase, partial [Desulfobacterales bacterium]